MNLNNKNLSVIIGFSLILFSGMVLSLFQKAIGNPEGKILSSKDYAYEAKNLQDSVFVYTGATLIFGGSGRLIQENDPIVTEIKYASGAVIMHRKIAISSGSVVSEQPKLYKIYLGSGAVIYDVLTDDGDTGLFKNIEQKGMIKILNQEQILLAGEGEWNYVDADKNQIEIKFYEKDAQGNPIQKSVIVSADQIETNQSEITIHISSGSTVQDNGVSPVTKETFEEAAGSSSSGGATGNATNNNNSSTNNQNTSSSDNSQNTTNPSTTNQSTSSSGGATENSTTNNNSSTSNQNTSSSGGSSDDSQNTANTSTSNQNTSSSGGSSDDSQNTANTSTSNQNTSSSGGSTENSTTNNSSSNNQNTSSSGGATNNSQNTTEPNNNLLWGKYPDTDEGNYDLATDKLNPNYCDRIEDQMLRATCKEVIFEALGKCDLLSDTEKQRICRNERIKQQALSSESISKCAEIKDDQVAFYDCIDAVNQKLYDAAIAAGDPAICKAIYSAALMEKCQKDASQ